MTNFDGLFELVDHIDKQRDGFLFHRTDRRNLPLIRDFGILSAEHLITANISPWNPVGSALTSRLDWQKGFAAYAYLSFDGQNMMPKQTPEVRRNAIMLKIHPGVLLMPGVLISLGRANNAGTEIYPAHEAPDRMDIEAFCGQLDREDSHMRARVAQAYDYEVLVPAFVPPQFIGDFHD